MDELFNFDPENFITRFSLWIENLLASSGAQGTICGLSGGIDSAVTAVLLKKVLGNRHKSIFVDIESSPEDYEDAKLLADYFQIELEKINLTDIYRNLLLALPEGNRLARANLKPRLRMMTFYYYANNENRLVAGTGNKTELMVGYFTKYGDGGVDFLPIGDLYKTQVRMLAKYLKIPEKIITKPPSAGLWQGQTDEGELGISYEELDKALALIEAGRGKEVPAETFEKVKKMVERSKHKLALPPVFELRG